VTIKRASTRLCITHRHATSFSDVRDLFATALEHFAERVGGRELDGEIGHVPSSLIPNWLAPVGSRVQLFCGPPAESRYRPAGQVVLDHIHTST